MRLKSASAIVQDGRPDIVAADSFAATLFGLQPDDLAYVKAGAAMGLGSSDLASLRIEQVDAAP